MGNGNPLGFWYQSPEQDNPFGLDLPQLLRRDRFGAGRFRTPPFVSEDPQPRDMMQRFPIPLPRTGPLSGDYGNAALARLGVQADERPRLGGRAPERAPLGATAAPSAGTETAAAEPILGQRRPLSERYEQYLGREPTAEQFPSKESGAHKFGRILTTIAWPQLGQAIFKDPAQQAEQQFEQAHKQWEQQGPRLAEQARIANVESEIASRQAPKPEKPEAIDREVYDSIIAQGKSPQEALEIIKGAGKPGEPPRTTEYEDWKKQHPGGTVEEWERTKRPDLGAGRNQARADRSYQFHAGRVDKLRQPVEQRMERISRLEDTLNQNSPQADALVAPELLTVMAGGQGSGLRMNEAEIARIIGGRTNWESLKAKVNAWNLDPNKPFALTPAQRQQTRQLFAAIRDRVSKKARAIDEESQNLVESDDPKGHRRIYNRLQKRLSDIDAGVGGARAAGAGQGGGLQVIRDASGRIVGIQ